MNSLIVTIQHYQITSLFQIRSAVPWVSEHPRYFLLLRSCDRRHCVGVETECTRMQISSRLKTPTERSGKFSTPESFRTLFFLSKNSIAGPAG